MIDVAVGLLALITGGITLELFAQSNSARADETRGEHKPDTRDTVSGLQELLIENPS